jgi:hypothetical protein
MAVGKYSYSLTAGNNGTASANINFAEGQSPASVNNSARALMAEDRAWVDALGGGITYGGSGNIYTATNASAGAWSEYTAGRLIGFIPNATNSGTATLNVDGLGAKAIKKSASTDIAAGDLVQSAFYLLRYDGTNFQILGDLGGSYQPLDAQLSAWAAVTPSSGSMYYWSSLTALTEIPSTTTVGRSVLVAASAAALATLAGLGTGDSPQFTAVNFGGTDSTLARAGSGLLSVEGNIIPHVAYSPTLTNNWFFQNGKLFTGDTDDSHFMQIRCLSNFTGNRTFGIVMGDADRTLTLGGDSSINGTALVTGGSLAAGNETTGTLTAASANDVIAASGGITLPASVFAARDTITIDANGTARTITRGSGLTMYFNGSDVASATLAAQGMMTAYYRSATVCIITGNLS